MSILSIQSHVSYGHAGNSASVFPLQRMGHTVWPVHTVLFSNHTGYGKTRGPVIDASSIEAIVDGIFDVADVSQCQLIMTGYIGSEAIAALVKKKVCELRELNPTLHYACDPVMGDVGRGFYTAKTIQQQFKHQLVPISDSFAPNHFELSFLSDREIDTLPQAVAAARSLLTRENQMVLLTSFKEKNNEAVIHSLAITHDEAYCVTTPQIVQTGVLAGSGDLFHALFMGQYIKSQDLQAALTHAVNAIYPIIEDTLNTKSAELRLIANQERLVAPKIQFSAVTL